MVKNVVLALRSNNPYRIIFVTQSIKFICIETNIYFSLEKLTKHILFEEFKFLMS